MNEDVLLKRDAMQVAVHSYMVAARAGAADLADTLAAAKSAIHEYTQAVSRLRVLDPDVDGDVVFSTPEKMTAYHRHTVREAIWGTAIDLDYLFADNLPVYAGNNAIVLPREPL